MQLVGAAALVVGVAALTSLPAAGANSRRLTHRHDAPAVLVVSATTPALVASAATPTAARSPARPARPLPF